MAVWWITDTARVVLHTGTSIACHGGHRGETWWLWLKTGVFLMRALHGALWSITILQRRGDARGWCCSHVWG